jgi:hypothetical protein
MLITFLLEDSSVHRIRRGQFSRPKGWRVVCLDDRVQATKGQSHRANSSENNIPQKQASGERHDIAYFG